MPSQRNRAPSQDSSPPSPPPPPNNTQGRNRKYQSRNRAYSDPRERKSRDITIVLCVYHGVTSGWRTVPYTFNPNRINDEELWLDIRDLYRHSLQKEWRRILLFKRLKTIAPIEFSCNDVPIRQDPKNVPACSEFMQCYHNPTRIRSRREWVKWFVEFDAINADKTYGLEFIEGVWAEKLGLIAIAINIAIIIASIIWYVKGGELQTIFTVMGFVITAAAADIALIALYFQIVLPG